MLADVIASVAVRNFKALRNTSVRLEPFNLVLGPNGSGKTSLIEAIVHLRDLAKLPPLETAPAPAEADDLDIVFRFAVPYEALEARLGCNGDGTICRALHVTPPLAPAWPALAAALARVRSYVFDYAAMAAPAAVGVAELAPDGSNLAAVLATMRDRAPLQYAGFAEEALRLFPEFSRLDLIAAGTGSVALALTLRTENKTLTAAGLSQGILHTLAVLALAFTPEPPTVVCIEEIDRGVHPRMLREIRDALYRLSHPADFGLARPPVQVIATTHSPYLLDLFREHPEEVLLMQKSGAEARFERLSDRADLEQLLEEGSLGDLWFSGLLGSVPESP